MAIDNFAPEFFEQEVSPMEMFEFPWVAMGGNRNIATGNKLSWPDLEGSVSSASYTDNADVTYNGMSDLVYSITVADFRATGWYVTDIERSQRIANAMAVGMTQSAREQMVNLTAVIRTAYRSSARLAASGLDAPVRGDADGLSGNVSALELIRVGGSGSAHSRWDTAAARLEILGEVQAARRYFRRHGHRGRFVCIAPGEIIDQINKILTVDKVNLGAGALVDSAFTTGQVPMIYDCEFHDDDLVAQFNTGSTIAANAGLRMDFMIPGLSVKYISEPITAEVMRDNDKIRDNGRTLWLNGAGQDAARFLRSTTIQLSNS